MLKIAGRISCELLGGSNTGYVNEILIYSVREMAGKWMELLPLASSEVDGIKGLDDHLFPPEYLIRIICCYYWNEWVHVIEIYTGKHFKIDTLDILR